MSAGKKRAALAKKLKAAQVRKERECWFLLLAFAFVVAHFTMPLLCAGEKSGGRAEGAGEEEETTIRSKDPT